MIIRWLAAAAAAAAAVCAATAPVPSCWIDVTSWQHGSPRVSGDPLTWV